MRWASCGSARHGAGDAVSITDGDCVVVLALRRTAKPGQKTLDLEAPCTVAD